MHINVLRNWAKYRVKGMLSAVNWVQRKGVLTDMEKLQLEIVQYTLETIITDWVSRLEDNK